MPLLQLQNELTQAEKSKGSASPLVAKDWITKYKELTGFTPEIYTRLNSPIAEVRQSVTPEELKQAVDKYSTIMTRAESAGQLNPDYVIQLESAYDKNLVKTTKPSTIPNTSTALEKSSYATKDFAPDYAKYGEQKIDLNRLKKMGLYKEPTDNEVMVGASQLKSLLKEDYPDYTTQDWQNMAKDQLRTQNFNIAVREAKGQLGESEISQLIAGMPAKYQEQEANLAKRLGEYGGQIFKEETLPAITQNYGARGIADSGALNVALAKESGKIARDIETQLAPGAVNNFLTSQGLSLEQSLRKAQQAGKQGEALQQYGQNLYGTGLSQLGDQSRANLASSLSRQNYAFQQPYMKDMYNYQSGVDLGSKKNMLDYQYGLQSDYDTQQSGGGILGMLLSAGLGAGLGGIIPGITAGQGALAGLTGRKTW